MFSGVRGDRLVRPWGRAPPVALGERRGQPWRGSRRRPRQEPSPGGRVGGGRTPAGGTGRAVGIYPVATGHGDSAMSHTSVKRGSFLGRPLPGGRIQGVTPGGIVQES